MKGPKGKLKLKGKDKPFSWVLERKGKKEQHAGRTYDLLSPWLKELGVQVEVSSHMVNTTASLVALADSSHFEDEASWSICPYLVLSLGTCEQCSLCRC